MAVGERIITVQERVNEKKVGVNAKPKEKEER